jgi:hypothetical protein
MHLFQLFKSLLIFFFSKGPHIRRTETLLRIYAMLFLGFQRAELQHRLILGRLSADACAYHSKRTRCNVVSIPRWHAVPLGALL